MCMRIYAHLGEEVNVEQDIYKREWGGCLI